MHATAARTSLRQFRGTTAAELCEVAIRNSRMLSRPGIVVNSRGCGKLLDCVCEEDACGRWSLEERVSWDRICATT